MLLGTVKKKKKTMLSDIVKKKKKIRCNCKNGAIVKVVIFVKKKIR